MGSEDESDKGGLFIPKPKEEGDDKHTFKAPPPRTSMLGAERESPCTSRHACHAKTRSWPRATTSAPPCMHAGLDRLAAQKREAEEERAGECVLHACTDCMHRHRARHADGPHVVVAHQASV